MTQDPVADEVNRLRVQEKARRIIADEKREGLTLSGKRMTTWLEEEDTPMEWRIQDLHQVGDNTTLAAAYKTGKSTMFTNLIRSLADGTPFLGDKAVKPVTGSIYYWNLEVGERRMRHWLRRLNIDNARLVVPENLRGQRIPLSDEGFQEELIEHLKSIECEVWMIDPLGRILSSWPGFHGRENNNDVMREVGEVLDKIKAQAGVQDLFVATHTGRAGEHTRGATVTDDWPDALWHMTKRQVIDDEPPTRFFWAEGRDVELEEVPLGFDKETGRTWIELNLQSQKIVGHARQVVKALILADGPLNATQMRTQIKNVDNNSGGKEAAVADAVKREWVDVKFGPRGVKLHHLNLDNAEVQLMVMEQKGTKV